MCIVHLGFTRRRKKTLFSRNIFNIYSNIYYWLAQMNYIICYCWGISVVSIREVSCMRYTYRFPFHAVYYRLLILYHLNHSKSLGMDWFKHRILNTNTNDGLNKSTQFYMPGIYLLLWFYILFSVFKVQQLIKLADKNLISIWILKWQAVINMMGGFSSGLCNYTTNKITNNWPSLSHINEFNG